MRSQDEFETVLRLIAEGSNDIEAARVSGVPRSTVRDWRRGAVGKRSRRVNGRSGCQRSHDLSSLPSVAYSYLLGNYLGDGHLARYPRDVWQLRITQDAKYPGIIRECREAMERLMPGQRAYCLSRSGCVVISMYSKHWPCLFPQHGPGRKHERRIRLESWQQEHVKKAPESFVRGLIHSDGCRVVASDRGLRSVRYHFSNRSEDIKEIFCEALDSLGIRWTKPSDREIAIYRKAAVARMDSFVGPKK